MTAAPGCTVTASCEEGDHTYSWPCDLAPTSSVVQRETRCFIVKEDQTGPYPDPSPHYDTRAEAEPAFGDYDMTGRMEQWAEPCWLAKCADCGTVLGGEDFDEAHYDCREEAERHAEANDDHCDVAR